jgi:hypothetical protein
MHSRTSLIGLMALFSVVSLTAFGASVKGMIMTRTGETLIVKTNQGNVTVVLTDSTKTKDDTGVFGLGTDTMSSVVLIPGLKVDVDGTSDDQGRVVAKTITVDGDDLETSEMIQSGFRPLPLPANRQRSGERLKKFHHSYASSSLNCVFPAC